MSRLWVAVGVSACLMAGSVWADEGMTTTGSEPVHSTTVAKKHHKKKMKAKHRHKKKSRPEAPAAAPADPAMPADAETTPPTE